MGLRLRQKLWCPVCLESFPKEELSRHYARVEGADPVGDPRPPRSRRLKGVADSALLECHGRISLTYRDVKLLSSKRSRLLRVVLVPSGCWGAVDGFMDRLVRDGYRLLCSLYPIGQMTGRRLGGHSTWFCLERDNRGMDPPGIFRVREAGSKGLHVVLVWVLRTDDPPSDLSESCCYSCRQRLRWEAIPRVVWCDPSPSSGVAWGWERGLRAWGLDGSCWWYVRGVTTRNEQWEAVHERLRANFGAMVDDHNVFSDDGESWERFARWFWTMPR